MADYTVVNLKDDVKDMAPEFGMKGMQSRFARTNLQLKNSGLSHLKLEANFRIPFGHKHKEQEEIYVVLEGSGRVKIEDDIVDLKAFDATRIPPGAIHGFEAGADGAELLFFGAPNTDNKDIEMVQDWWKD